ncbi:MAG: hypothetical protein ACD_19C00264G0004 [uncultured bacterium]|nr:MAG: hypothetical protein ACD_19C00264G0004 [uncultured bacterium]
MNYYIFVSADVSHSDLRFPSAYTVAKYRMTRQEWGLNERTSYRKKVDIGDKVLVYISGRREHCQSFIGYAEVETSATATCLNNRSIIDAPNDKGLMMPPYSVKLCNTCYFDRSVEIRAYKERLSFIKSIDTWWRYMQRGILKISPADYGLIVDIGMIKY